MKRNTHFFDLFWEDIIVSNILPYLTIRECFHFRCVSKTCVQIVNIYLTKIKTLKLMNNVFPRHAFSVSVLFYFTIELPVEWFNVFWFFQVLAATCSRLHVLNLSRCGTLTDADLIPLLRKNIHLVNLNLSQCNSLSAKCLQPVILFCNDLKTLKLARCMWLTTGAMEALALHQNNLEDVDLSHCITISESCILIFIKKFKHLRTFNLEGNKQITDKCLYAMSKNSPALRMLNLGGCSDITDKGIRWGSMLLEWYL